MFGPVAFPPHLRGFIQQHGEAVPATRGSSDLLFRDGATVEGSIANPPPTDPVELAIAERRYLLRKLEIEENDWSSFRMHVSEMAANSMKFPQSCPAPGEYELDQLEAGRVRIHALRVEIQELDDAIAEGRRQREGMDAEMQRRQGLSSFAERLSRLQI